MQKTVEVKHGNIEEQLPSLTSSQEKFTQLLASKRFNAPNVELQTNDIAALETTNETVHGIESFA